MFFHGQTDGRTDGQTDRQTDGRTDGRWDRKASHRGALLLKIRILKDGGHTDRLNEK